MKRPRFDFSAGAAFAAAALLFFLRPGELAALLPAIIVHELGHLAAIWALGLAPAGFRAEAGGFLIEVQGDAGPAGQGLIAAAGPLAGLLYAWAAARLSVAPGREWLALSAGLSLLLSLFNLLPVPLLDGGRLCAALASALPNARLGERLCRLLGLAAALAVLAAGLATLRRGGGAAPALVGARLLFSAVQDGEGLVKTNRIR